MYSLIKSCLSCTSCGRSTHRHGRTGYTCSRFGGIEVDVTTVPGKTIGCEYFKPRTMRVLAAKAAEMPDYLL